MLYVLQREGIQHAQLRALAQAVINREKGKEVFDEYMKVAFPWLETQKKRDHSEHARILIEEVKRGGLAITKPLWEVNPVRSRLKTRVIARDAKPSPKKTKEQMDSVYKKLGKRR